MLYHHYAELIAFIVGCVVLKKYWLREYKILVLLAGITFLVEISGHVMWIKFHQNNNWLYNIFLPFQCFCFLFLFYKAAIYKSIKHINYALLIFLFAGTAISYCFHRNFIFLNSYASTLYLVLMLIASGCFYIDAILNELEIKLVKQPPFWVATGMLFFTVIYILIFALWNELIKVPYYKLILFYSTIVANTFLYGGLIACFLCLRKTKIFSMPSL